MVDLQFLGFCVDRSRNILVFPAFPDFPFFSQDGDPSGRTHPSDEGDFSRTKGETLLRQLKIGRGFGNPL